MNQDIYLGYELWLRDEKGEVKFSAGADGSHIIEITTCDSSSEFEITKEQTEKLIKYLQYNLSTIDSVALTTAP